MRKETERRMREENERRAREEREERREHERGFVSSNGNEDDFYHPRRVYREKREPRKERRAEVRNEMIKLPKFVGSSNVESYLDWEMKVDQVFLGHKLEDERKIQLATLEFESYAMIWWHQVHNDIQRRRRDPIRT